MYTLFSFVGFVTLYASIKKVMVYIYKGANYFKRRLDAKGRKNVKKPESEENKKVKNAKKVTVCGINFKSKLESQCYLLLRASGLNFAYEPERITLLNGFTDRSVLVYDFSKENSYNPVLKPMKTIRAWTYTPDFVIDMNDVKIYIEVKGLKTDTFAIKQKMFMKYLSDRNKEDGMERQYALIENLKSMSNLISYLIHEIDIRRMKAKERAGRL